MTYSIIGTGAVGSALARHFARSGIAVGIANTRQPGTLAATAQAHGDTVVPLTLPEALQADVVILAVPFGAHAGIAAALPRWDGKVVVDAMNTYGITAAELGDRPSTEVVASAFKGAKVVKAFNQLPAHLLAQDPAANGGRRVMFVSSNDAEAEAVIAGLAGELGFAPIGLGQLDEGGRLIAFGGAGQGGPLVLQNLVRHG